jgi:enamine deaminase RidA (YjgF/YER057c/UK114 family)
MKKSDVVVPKGMEMAYEQFHFAPAIRTGKWLRCSGQLGTDEKFQAIVEPEAQFAQAFENVKSVLAAAKLGFGDVVELTTFHVGLREHLGTFMKVKDRYLEAPYPAWTAIGVVELAVPDALVEIRATARLRDGAVGRRRAAKSKGGARQAKRTAAKGARRKKR